MQPAPQTSPWQAIRLHPPFLLGAGARHGEPVLRWNSVQVPAAADPADRSIARELVRRLYAWRGYEHGPLLGSHPAQTTLLAQRGPDTLGTLTLGLDSAAGLLADGLYPREVRELRRAGRQLCELTALAVARVEDSRQILAALFQGAYRLGREQHRVTDLVIEVNPRHVAYYRRCLGFREAGPLRLCPRVAAPAVLLHLDLEAADRALLAA